VIATALILSGGTGERLRPLTNDRPKPMIKVAGRPILEYQVTWLAREGVQNIVFACGYRANIIQDYFGDGSQSGIRARYSLEREPLGSGGALKLAATGLSPSETEFIAVNGDNLTYQPLRPLIHAHRRHQGVATMMVTRLVSAGGITRLDRSNRVVSFEEKPPLPFWLNAGVYVLSREFFDRLSDRGDHETTTLPELAREGRLFAYRSRAFWRTINTAKDLSEIERIFRDLPPGQRWPPS